ncbi:deaminase domain-containing protein [Paenibacillus sp. FSL K6-1230]|uniref:deaminase domain-containing protein n=1 Tax=Paenibacillus sp. FSL K6-1230 TaxID=2921603 RepID=UPI0030F4C3AE
MLPSLFHQTHQFVGSDGLHLGTTTEKLDPAEQVNSQGTEVQLEASVHQFYGEPILSAFEQQVAEKGIGMVMASRALDNALEEGKGALDAGIEFVEGVWNFAVDVVDMGAQLLNPVVEPGEMFGKGFLEHNETQAGLGRAVEATGTYIADTVTLKKSWSELGNDIVGAGESLIDPFVKVYDDKGNVLTRSAEESYNAGYNQIKAAERAVDIIGFAKGAAKLAKSVGDMSKGTPAVHGESTGGKSGSGSGNSGGRGMVAPRWNDTLHEAVKSLGGDGKLKTNALRLPLDIASLESFMQSLANRMNIFSKRLIPVGFGKISNGRPRWEFEDYSRMDSNGRGGSGGGPDKPPKDHHEDERKRREDEEQQRKDEEAEGTGESDPNVSIGKVFPTRKIDLNKETHILDRVSELRGKLSNRLKDELNFAYSEVDIAGIDKKEFYAHSSLNGDNKAKDYADFSLKPPKPKYEATLAPDRGGNIRLRDNDTEYKILNDLAARLDKLPDPSKASGKIKLFTELDTCASCSRVIERFHKDYPNIDIEIIHNGDELVIPKNP